MESGRPSRKSRRRPRRRPTGAMPARSGGPEGRAGMPVDLPPQPPDRRPAEPASLARRRPVRSPRPESQSLNLRRLLSQPSRSQERDARRDDASLAPVRPLRPVPSRSAPSSPPVIPIQARPVQALPPGKPKPLRRRRRPTKPPSPLLYATRLLIFGVGVGAIVGTVLSIWNPPPAPLGTTPGEPDPALAAAQVAKGEGDRPFQLDGEPPQTPPVPFAARLRQPLPGLAEQIQPFLAVSPDLRAGVFVVDLDTGDYLDLNGSTPLPAASTIKVPILVAFLQDVDTNQASLDEMLTLQANDMAVGSGELQYAEIGSQFSALDVASKMITISDNTATNILLRRVGGIESANQRFQGWGLSNTAIRNLLADLEGTNTTSAQDLSLLLTAVAQGDLLSLRSRDRFLEIMRGTVNNTLIPTGTDPDAVVAHKTGTIDGMVGDTGIVDMPNGRRYVLTVLVQRPVDDPRAQELIRQIASTTYQYFSQPPQPTGLTPSATPTPTPTTEDGMF